MPQNLPQKRQKQAKRAKSYKKIQNGKAIEHSKRKVFKFETNSENQNFQNFVILNRRKSFEKLGGKMLENIKELDNQVVIYLNLNVLILYMCGIMT